MYQLMSSRVCAFISLLAMTLLLAPVSRSAPVDAGKAVVEMVSDHAVVTPGSEVRGALTLKMDPHWHVYWQNAGDSGLPAEIDWAETSGVTMGAFQWPLPHPQPLETLMNYGYENELVLPFAMSVPETASGTVQLTGMANYLICYDVCIPESGEISLTLQVGDENTLDPDTQAYFQWADARLPMPFAGTAQIDRTAGDTWKLSLKDKAVRAAFEGQVSDVRFYPKDHQILHPPKQPVALGPEGITLTLQKGDDEVEAQTPLEGVLVVTDIDKNRIGFELTAQPGAVLAGTNDNALLLQEKADAQNLSLSVFLGILTAALIGGAILNLMPCVLPVLFIKVQSFLSLSGHEARKIRSHGLFYTLGVVVCFIGFGAVLAVLRAAGEQVGLGFQLQIPIIVAGLALLMFVLGLNMMGMFEIGGSLMGVGSSLAEKGGAQGAFFTGVLAAFVGAPCVGPFIGGATGILLTQSVPAILLVFAVLGLGMALPFALISFFPALISFLPKPGAWMKRLRQFFAFPLFLTAVWLISVLGDLAGQIAITATIVGAVVITFAIWVFTSSPTSGAKRAMALGAGAVFLIAGLAIPAVPILALPSNATTISENHSDKAGSIYDADWSPEKLAELRKEGKAVFVDFTASWCVTCQVNKATTLRTERVQRAFNDQQITFLVADWTKKDKTIGEELARHGRAGVPLYLFYPQGYPQGKDNPVILPQLLTPEQVIKIVSESR